MLFIRPLPAPPASTLFPYTTLFRSGNRDAGERELGYREALASQAPDSPTIMLSGDFSEESGYRAGQQELAIDRKSTRLNSSHVENSYAVFCLKKKTGDIGHTQFVPSSYVVYSTATRAPGIYTLSLHDALPIWQPRRRRARARLPRGAGQPGAGQPDDHAVR